MTGALTPGRSAAFVASPISQLIRHADAGYGAAADGLFATLYRELHAIAERQRHRGGAELSLGTTTLLHETTSTSARGKECSSPAGASAGSARQPGGADRPV